jgi:hypothetical protein
MTTFLIPSFAMRVATSTVWTSCGREKTCLYTISESLGSTESIKTGASSPYRFSMNRVSGFTSPHRDGTYRPGSDLLLNSAYPITLAMLSVSGLWCPKR